MTHELKTLPEYFNAILSGKKSFEVRKDDRDPKFAPGDKLILQEYMNGIYTGRVIHADVLLVLRGEYCRDGYCIMSIIPTYAVNAKFEVVTEHDRLKVENATLKSKLEHWENCFNEPTIKHILDVSNRIEQERDTLKKALEIGLMPSAMNCCPSKNAKLAVKCRDGWEQDKNVCLKCWTDWTIQQAKEAMKDGQHK